MVRKALPERISRQQQGGLAELVAPGAVPPVPDRALRKQDPVIINGVR